MSYLFEILEANIMESVESLLNADDREFIRKLIEIEWPAAMRARDWDKLLASCSQDIVYMPPDHPVLYGHVYFRKWLDQLPSIKAFVQTLKEIDIQAPLAITRSSFSITIEISGQSILQTGNVLGWLHRSNSGRWLTKSVCFNYDEVGAGPGDKALA